MRQPFSEARESSPVRNPLKSSTRKPPKGLALRVYEEYGVELERFLGRRAPSAEDARDLAQNVYLRLLQIPRDQVVRNPQGFMYRIARNIAHEFRLRDRNNPVVCDSDLVEEFDARTAEEDTIDPAHRLNLEREIQQLLDTLPKNYKACLLMRKRLGMSPDEIAKELGLTRKTVQRYLIRAMAHFRKEYRER
jgi:RNA polymerase sigma factor (sigma-70 family)